MKQLKHVVIRQPQGLHTRTLVCIIDALQLTLAGTLPVNTDTAEQPRNPIALDEYLTPAEYYI